MPTIKPYAPFPAFQDFAETADFSEETFELFARQFQDLKGTVSEDALKRSVDGATRAAAVDTGAIEDLYTTDRGVTMTIAASAAALDSGHLDLTTETIEHIRDALAGYEFVLDVATQAREASEQWIKELHATICRSQETFTVHVLVDGKVVAEQRPLAKGQYKADANNPTRLGTEDSHYYASPGEETVAEMGRLISELRSPEFSAAHPVLQAAYAHYAFVAIHPFSDGNGRVARALASTYYYREPGVPLVIFADQKAEYFAGLEAADEGDTSKFVQFIADRGIDIISLIKVDVTRPLQPATGERIKALRKVMQAPSGLTHVEMDALAGRVGKAWSDALTAAASEVDAEIKWHHNNGGQPGAVSGYRVAPGSVTRLIMAEIVGPPRVTLQSGSSVQTPRAGTDITAAFVVFDQEGKVLCEIALREAHPVITATLIYKLELVARHVIEGLVDKVVEAEVAALRQQGYIE